MSGTFDFNDPSTYPTPPIPPPDMSPSPGDPTYAQSQGIANAADAWAKYNASAGAGGGDLAKTLAGLSGSLGKLAGPGQMPQSRLPNIPQASVGRPGAPVSLSNLLQILLQKQNAYFPGTANTQPVTMARPTGILGM